MPITTAIPIAPVTKDAFNEIDAAVMRCSYASQNYFGRLCEEQVYENDVALRLKAEGFQTVHTQVKVVVSHESFKKDYWLDLIVNQVVYELKATTKLIPEHEAQALNYAALMGLNRIKLINFGSAKVEGKLLGTPFATMDRKNVIIDKTHWNSLSKSCEKLAESLEKFIFDVGGYLRAEIYEEMLIGLCGGLNACVHRLPIVRDGIELGNHSCRLYDDELAFIVTSLQQGKARQNYAQHLQSLIKTLPIKAFQWINIHHLEVSYITIENSTKVSP